MIRLRKNQGVTGALMESFKRAKHSVIVFYPADLQYLPEDMPKLIEPLVNDSTIDIVCAKRVGHYNKWFVSGIYTALSRFFFDVKVSDQNSSKAFRQTLLKELHLRSNMHRYIVAIAGYKGYKVTEVPLKLYQRTKGKSKFVSPLRMVSGILDLLSIKFELTFLDRPMIFFGGFGIFFICLGVMLGGSYYPLKWLQIISWQAKFVIFITAWGTIITGLFLLCFGVLSDFVLRLMPSEIYTPSIIEYRPLRADATGENGKGKRSDESAGTESGQ